MLIRLQGGGSTFGVITSLTIKTHPSTPVIGINWGVATANLTDPDLYNVVAWVLSQFPQLSNSGLSGYSYFLLNQTLPFGAGMEVPLAGLLASFIHFNKTDPADTMGILNPIIEHVNSTWPAYFGIIVPTPYDSFAAWYAVNYDQSAAGHDQWVGSHLLDYNALTGNLTALADAYKQMVVQGGATAYLVGGHGVMDAQPRGGSNAVNPGWRKTYVHASE